MKFSYKLLKQLVPQIKNQNDLADKLTMHAFEVDSMEGDTIDIKLPPNRYSDAGSHWGIAREIAAISNYKLKTKNYGQKEKNKQKPNFSVKIQDKNLCPRYTAQYFEDIKIGASPKWIQNVLRSCGLRPINNVVDIMNYAMLETGQPLHAFDADKLHAENGGRPIIIRKAKNGEKITSLDGEKYNMESDMLVIADEKGLLAIAGIKGGQKAGVDKNTRKIIIESANFDPNNIYKTSKKLHLSTDASLRFSRNISPELAILGLNRASQLLQEIVKAVPGGVIDSYPRKQPKKILKFNIEKFYKFIGLKLDFKTLKKYFENLGFIIKVPANQIKEISEFFVEISLFRRDIETFEDLAEEAARLYGFNKINSLPPYAFLRPSGSEDQIVLKNKIRKILTGLGISEVYSYSFISEKDKATVGAELKSSLIELENPISSEFKYLRPNLKTNLLKAAESNTRFFDKVSIFEIGKVFSNSFKNKESLMLSIILSEKSGETFFRLKGIAAQMFDKIGFIDYSFIESEENLLLIKSGSNYLGYIKKIFNAPKRHISLLEADLEKLLALIEEEHEFRPLSKFPSITRDISVVVSPSVKVGDILSEIQLSSPKYIEDVDLIDEYDLSVSALSPQSAISYTFRIIFQAADRTLTDQEVDKEMGEIIRILKSKFRASIR